ncbi:DUF72 domain-containing protein [Phormidium sp. CLA17]|uniref:DUF72 domain-containing protein n=1 Tax=Leptolyngbya sp. Cla-17 TaxID=2803751 RepID=UPI001492A494|nr:DUF72 domain-containing protein [Leptolyngbya sp. Cla-17]MBM0743339.1 DUF72 domain-containing protein [Leptolyngbya sp. Cla-17]
MPPATNFFIGCALWGYKDWVGELFPPGSQASNFLQLYSQRFTTVEGNTTFYSVPDAKTVARWAATTPEGFRFCPKLPKQVTHTGLLYPQLPQAQQFVEQMQGLCTGTPPANKTRLGPIFAQLPPSYSPDYFSDLQAFLTALVQENAEFALEVRHQDWFKPPCAQRLTALLHRLGIGRVLLDTRPIYDVPDDPQLHSERKKPRVPVEFSVTASFSLIRYISHPNPETNLPFLQDWLTYIDQWLRQGTHIYLFVHCPLEARSPANARYFHHLLEQYGAPIPPLPWNTLDHPPTQLSLL